MGQQCCEAHLSGWRQPGAGAWGWAGITEVRMTRSRESAERSRKSLPEFVGSHTLGIFSASEMGSMPVSTGTVIKGDVKNIKTPKIGFLVLAAWLVCFHPQFVKAGEEPLPVELSAGGNEPSGSELGLGKFSALPFQLSATLR